MASTKETLNKFIKLMRDFEKNEFSDDEKTMIYNGELYTRGDFNNMERALKQVQKTYQGGVNKSIRYLQKNKEYNRTLRMINYYKTKKDKSIRDFERLEKLQKEFDRITTERDELKLEHDKNKIIKDEIELEKKKYMKSGLNNDDIK